MIVHRPLAPEHRPLIADLLGSLSAFTDDERAVALELVDARLKSPEVDDYRFILSFVSADAQDGGEERLAGYVCYGRTPMTQFTYDLYWIATSPAFARSGIARGLVAKMEEEIARAGGGIVRVETGSREGHGAAVHFYDALGFSRAARIDDFYAPGDDLLIFTKRVLGVGARVDVPGNDDAALFDAAFGHRDYAADREFFLACSRRFGGREVRRVIEWSCGSARHLGAFADMGIAGLGVDASDAMLAYAARVYASRGASSPTQVRFARAALNERPVTLPNELADLSFVPLSSIHVLRTTEALVEHLRAAASLLAPGGLHIIEATHPGDILASGVSRTEWTEVRGDQVIDARFRIHIERATPERVVPVTLEVVASPKRSGGGGAPSSLSSLRQEDLWYIPDIAGWRAAVAAVPELSLAAALGDFSVDVPFEHPKAWRLILVLKRSSMV